MNKKTTSIGLTIIMLSSILLIALFSFIFIGTSDQEPVFAQEQSSTYLLNKEKADYATLTQLLNSNQPLVWTFNGSSTTANGGHYSNNYRNYVEIIESRMRTEYSRENDRFINLAVGGYTVNNFSYYEPKGAASYKPDIAYINIGKNDANKFLSKEGSFYYSGTTVPAIGKLNPNLQYFKKKVEQFIDEARADGALVILGAPNSMKMSYGEAIQRIFYEEYFAPVIREIASEKQVLLVDYLTHFVNNRVYADSFWFTDDGIHCNQLGYLEHARTFFTDLGMYDSESLFSTLSFIDQGTKPYAPYYTPLELITNTDFVPEFDEVEPLFEEIINQNITESLDYTQEALEAANAINSKGEGSLVVRFRTTSTAASKRMLAFSADDEKESSVMLSAAYQRNFHCLSNGDLWSIKSIEVDDGAWHTAVIVSGASGTQIYLDGYLQYHNGRNLFDNDVPYTRVIIGGSKVDDANHFIGDISYLRMYDSELSVAQAIEISCENLPSGEETQLMEEFGYAAFSTQNLSTLLKTQPVALMGGAVTAGYMKESVVERSYPQYLFKNASKTNYQLVIGSIEELEEASSAVESQSVVFFMPEVLNSNGQLTKQSKQDYKESIISILDSLAKDKGCYVVLLTPYPALNNNELNAKVSEYVIVLNNLIEERGLVSLDIFDYIEQLYANNNSNIARNWVEENGLPNYIGHFEIAKRIAVFCGWGISSVASAPNHTLQFTNPDPTLGAEHDKLSAIIEEVPGSKGSRIINVSALIENYPDADFEFKIAMGEVDSRVYATNGIIKQKHPLKGSYTFIALAKVGEKTITFNPTVYTILELDDPEDNPPGTIDAESPKGLLGWQIALICVGGVVILSVIAAFVFEKQIKVLLKKIKDKSGAPKSIQQLPNSQEPRSIAKEKDDNIIDEQKNSE